MHILMIIYKVNYFSHQDIFNSEQRCFFRQPRKNSDTVISCCMYNSELFVTCQLCVKLGLHQETKIGISYITFCKLSKTLLQSARNSWWCMGILTKYKHWSTKKILVVCSHTYCIADRLCKHDHEVNPFFCDSLFEVCCNWSCTSRVYVINVNREKYFIVQ
jgi:hypothetical protein